MKKKGHSRRMPLFITLKQLLWKRILFLDRLPAQFKLSAAKVIIAIEDLYMVNTFGKFASWIKRNIEPFVFISR